MSPRKTHGAKQYDRRPCCIRSKGDFEWNILFFCVKVTKKSAGIGDEKKYFKNKIFKNKIAEMFCLD